MNPTEKYRLLADTILSCLKGGITIDNHTQQYIDACLPGLSLGEVASRICETPDLDAAPLMDLIFFPDEALQIRLEPLLEAQAYSRGDEAEVVALLEAEDIQTALIAPDGRPTAALRIPASVLAPFVRRLGIPRRISPGLAATISDIHSPETATRLKVMLRNARFSWTGSTSDFLEAFILGMDPGEEDFDACFGLILEMLGERATETDPFRLLRLKTDTLHKAREAALWFEKLLRRSNMETLMHQGIRAPEISAAAAEKNIALLDRIGRAVALGGFEARRRKELSGVDGELEPEDGSFFPG